MGYHALGHKLEYCIYFDKEINMRLYATLETSRGKTVSVSDNEQIVATVYDGNLKAYSVIIEFTNVGDPEGSEDEGGVPCMAAVVTTREWRNQPDERRKAQRNA